jgi:hypothetical protein
MAILIECSGCKKEMDKQRDKVHLQKSYNKEEYYCPDCNKFYYEWLAFKTDVFNKFDEEKKGVLEKGHKKIFVKKAKETEEPQPTKKEVTKHNAEQTVRADLSEIINKGTSELTADEIDRG